jgi:hypothetical protein
LDIYILVPIILTSTNETIYPLWNTFAGGNSTISTAGTGVGNYYPAEPCQSAFDRNSTTKYTNFGQCNVNVSLLICGANTGVYLTLQRGASYLIAVQFSAANNIPERDPLTLTIEGSNQISSALTLGSSWALIYNGSTGLDTDPGRYNDGIVQYIPNSIMSYSSYRVLITSKRSIGDAVQYSEVMLLGY